MELHNLKARQRISTHKEKRIGRGTRIRAWWYFYKWVIKAPNLVRVTPRKIGFEGGQMPLQRRLPKFGFKNPISQREYKPINIDVLQTLADKHNITSIDTFKSLH
jgi:large subunit ribosomal protein L15